MLCTLHCIHDCSYSCKHIRQDSNWVTVAIISTAQLQLCVPTKQIRLCTLKTYMHVAVNEQVNNQGMCQINVYTLLLPRPRLLSFDTLVPRFHSGCSLSCSTGGPFKVKGSSLWAAYYSLDYAGVTDNGRQGEQIMHNLRTKT